jgi:hypothetical protein
MAIFNSLTPSPNSLILRKLGTVERLHWLWNQNHPNHFVMAAHVMGATTETMWRSALKQIQRRHPFLNVFLDEDDQSGPTFHLAQGCEVPLVIKERMSAGQWQEELTRQLEIPFDETIAPLFRVVLLLEEDECDIILTSHHAIADGMSMVYLIRDLLQAVSGTTLDMLGTPPSQEERFASLYKTYSARASEDRVAAGPKKEKEIKLARKFGSPKVRSLRLSELQTLTLIRKAKQEGTTVHAAVCAALTLAGRDSSPAWNDQEIRVMSMINIRKLLGNHEDCALSVAVGIVPFEPKPSTDLWQLARWAKEALAPSLTLESIIELSHAVEKALPEGTDAEGLSKFASQGLKHDLVVTNVQRIPFDTNFGDIHLEAVWGPSALNEVEGVQAVALATTNDSMCLVHTSYTPIEDLLENAVGRLLDACSW